MKITNAIRTQCINALFSKDEWDGQSRMILLRSEYTNARRWRFTCYLLAKGKLTNDVVMKLATRTRQEPCEEKLILEKQKLLTELENPFSSLCGLIECIFDLRCDDRRCAVDAAMKEICSLNEINTNSTLGLLNMVLKKEMWSFHQAWSNAREIQELEDMFDELEDLRVN